jgi:hypothetical protein
MWIKNLGNNLSSSLYLQTNKILANPSVMGNIALLWELASSSLMGKLFYYGELASPSLVE